MIFQSKVQDSWELESKASKESPPPSYDDVQKSDEMDDMAAKVRGNWGSQLEFILTCVGYAVGLGRTFILTWHNLTKPKN